MPSAAAFKVLRPLVGAKNVGNEALNAFKGRYASAMASNIVKDARIGAANMAKAGRAVGSDFRHLTPGGAVKLAAGAVTGGATGYALSDDRDKASGSIKGFGLGLLGGAGWHASTNPLVKKYAGKGWGYAKDMLNSSGRAARTADRAAMTNLAGGFAGVGKSSGMLGLPAPGANFKPMNVSPLDPRMGPGGPGNFIRPGGGWLAQKGRNFRAMASNYTSSGMMPGF